ncbi:YitT family protein [Nitrincola iocasae]|uniref:YitT family protein n=1 Tax=Nitrincola iocasae TaxID=2614693 RepID=A0A5J6LEP1_9GAMM|nr:YitT family protein [Nitrincola iocasae]QEW07007.1 YitT family protein [Nitrincola iocasae]
MSTTHRWLSLFEGCLLVALGVHLLNAANLLISGTAGIGMILTQLTPLSFGQLFFLLNLPFYLLAWNTLGIDFTVRTFFSISMLAGLSELMRLFIHIDIDPLFSALLGGMLVGFGLILLFRHNASLGGLNILALYLERRLGVHASKTTLAGDALVLLLAVMVVDMTSLMYSLLAFLTLCSVVGRYHRPPEWARVQAHS